MAPVTRTPGPRTPVTTSSSAAAAPAPKTQAQPPEAPAQGWTPAAPKQLPGKPVVSDFAPTKNLPGKPVVPDEAPVPFKQLPGKPVVPELATSLQSNIRGPVETNQGPYLPAIREKIDSLMTSAQGLAAAWTPPTPGEDPAPSQAAQQEFLQTLAGLKPRLEAYVKGGGPDAAQRVAAYHQLLLSSSQVMAGFTDPIIPPLLPNPVIFAVTSPAAQALGTDLDQWATALAQRSDASENEPIGEGQFKDLRQTNLQRAAGFQKQLGELADADPTVAALARQSVWIANQQVAALPMVVETKHFFGNSVDTQPLISPELRSRILP